MKTKQITRKAVNQYQNIIEVPYDALHFALAHRQPEFYNAGTCGWNYNGYEINNNTILLTGYRNMKGNILIDREECHIFDEYVRTNMKNISYEEHEKLLESFVMEYIREA